MTANRLELFRRPERNDPLKKPKRKKHYWHKPLGYKKKDRTSRIRIEQPKEPFLLLKQPSHVQEPLKCPLPRAGIIAEFPKKTHNHIEPVQRKAA